jgi:pimeloyl-ACP methyl ester carboxylesterase
VQLEPRNFTYQGITCPWYEVGVGETIVFLPGWGAVAASYTPFLSILASQFRVVILELPGFGNTTTPGTVWSFAEYGALVDAFLSTLPQRHVRLSGHSFGAGVALYTATKNTNVKKLVLFDAAGIPTAYSRPKFFAVYLFDLLLDLLNPVHVKMSLKVGKIFLFNSRNIRYKFALAKNVFDKTIATDESVFKNITVPSVIFWGSKDMVFTKDVAEELNRKLQGETVRYVKGRHNWIIFAPQEMKNYLNLI